MKKANLIGLIIFVIIIVVVITVADRINSAHLKRVLAENNIDCIECGYEKATKIGTWSIGEGLYFIECDYDYIIYRHIPHNNSKTILECNLE